MTEANKDNNSVEEISEETSKRICTHMNEDHAVSVYAMAKAQLGMRAGTKKITDATLKKVTMEGCTIAIVTCHGEMCEMKKMTHPFDPPLKSGSEVRSRMVAIHHQVCAPRISWLFTDVFTLSVLIVMALLGYGTHVVGVENLANQIQGMESLNLVISQLFGSAATFSKLVRSSWFLALFLHDLEALYVLYQARMALKLKVTAQILWFLLIVPVGWPITKEFLDLLRVHQKQAKTEKSS